MDTLCLLPCLALSGSCLQYFSSMYSPVNAIEPFLASVSPFIDTCCTNKMYYLQQFCTYSDRVIFVPPRAIAGHMLTVLILRVGHL